MGDRRTEGAFLRALDVDMDPLVIVGRIGELVDAVLGDLEPLAGTEILADRLLERFGAAEFLSHVGSSCAPEGRPGWMPGRACPRDRDS